MIEYTLPCALEAALDDIGPGAMLKRLSDDARALYVDDGKSPRCGIVVMAKAEYAKSEALMTDTPEDYELTTIADPKDWIVLSLGGDLLILE